MPSIWLILLFVGAAYLLGAIPWGLLLGLARGVDIRTQGSHNIGATNVGRVLGRKWGMLCLALDILKGFIPTLVASLWLLGGEDDTRQQLVVVSVAVAAVLGHVFPIYLRFRGGKGVATTIGVALGVWPVFTLAMAAALVVYGVMRMSTGLVSMGSLGIAVVFPAAVFVQIHLSAATVASQWPLLGVSVLLGLVIIVRHRDNIQRLLRGEELRARRTG